MSDDDRADETPTTHVGGYFQWLSASMAGYERLAKSLISHPGEKGHAVEGIAKGALRSILPDRFCLGTGFIITASGQSSSQLDLVIYDAFYNAPIVLDSGVGLFPIEAVYGFVEVKSLLNGDGVEQIAKAIGRVRLLSQEKEYVGYSAREVEPGKPVAEPIHLKSDLPPRAYALALRSVYGEEPATLMEALERHTQADGAHVHGLAVLDRNWFISQHAYKRQHSFNVVREQAFAQFSLSVLKGVQSFAMAPAAMERYLSRPE